MKRACRCCGCWFVPRANVSNQQYCSLRTCQNARRQQWRKQKLSSDSDYKADQYAAQKRWLEKNPDYWKHYRACHPGYQQRNRKMQKHRNHKRRRSHTGEVVAKRYALKTANDIISGIYALSPAGGEMIAKSDALLVKLDVIPVDYAKEA